MVSFSLLVKSICLLDWGEKRVTKLLDSKRWKRKLSAVKVVHKAGQVVLQLGFLCNKFKYQLYLLTYIFIYCFGGFQIFLTLNIKCFKTFSL